MTDWDDAFDNVGYIPDAQNYIESWAQSAKAFRDGEVESELGLRYGASARERLDFFWPKHAVEGLALFIHGGYWVKLDRSYFSDLAQGLLARGWAVAIPSYTLAPEARIREISQQIASAITFSAKKVNGPICLAGHSAGGHLVTRMICKDGPLAPEIQSRIQNVLSISGLHDLRNLRKTKLNQMLRLSAKEAEAESACLNQPILEARITCWVGGAERPEFIRQSQLLHQAWGNAGAKISLHIAPQQHHFSVIDALKEPDSQMLHTLLEKV